MGVLGSLADVLLPRYCKVCGRRLSVGEQHLCAACLLEMPRLEYRHGVLNPAENRLMGETPLVRAFSYIRYQKESDYSKILYHLKYYGHPAVGRWMARQAARRLNDIGFFDGIDFMVPVPLSRSKHRKRGYNQCDYIAAGITDVTGLRSMAGLAVRVRSNQAQAQKGQLQRWNNAEDIFRVTDVGALRGRHILIVDDILTTGATVSSLIETIRRDVPEIRVSIFTIGLTD